MTPWLGRSGRGEAPTIAIVRASRRISAALRTSVDLPEPGTCEHEGDQDAGDAGAGGDERPRRCDVGDGGPDGEPDRRESEGAEEVEADDACEQALRHELLQHRLPDRDAEGEARPAEGGEAGCEPEPRRERDADDREAVHEPDGVGDDTAPSPRLELAERQRAEDGADAEEGHEQPVRPDAAVEVLVDELRQQHLLRRVLEREHDAEQRDRDPQPRDPGDVARALADLAQRPFARRGLDRPRPRERDQRRRDEERSRVEGEDDRRAAAVVGERGQRRADHDASPAGDSQQAVGRGERGLLDHERHDPADCGVEEAVAEPDEDGKADQDREGQMAHGVDGGEGADGSEPPDVREDHHAAPLVAVGQDAADQQRGEHRATVAEQDDAQPRRAGEGECAPGKGGEEGHVAEERDGLAAPEEPEVAVPERVQDAQPAARGGDGFHPPKAILRRCPTGSASPACSSRAEPSRRRTSRRPSASSPRPRQAELRPLADRRPVGHRRRAGTRRGNGDLGRARPGAARGGSPQPAVAREPRPGRLPLAHPGLVWLEESEEGREWLVRLPDLVHECTRRWRLELEEPFEYAFASLAVPAGDAVLKIQFPDRESEHEAEALRVWEGEGAVRLLEHDPERHAPPPERARPGTPLYEAGQDTALDVTLGLLPRLWKPVGAPFRPLAEEAAWWIDYMP